MIKGSVEDNTMKVENLLSALGASGLALTGSIPIKNHPVGKPFTITPEVTTILVRFPIGKFVKSLDDAAEFIQQLNDAEQENGNRQINSLVDDTLIKSLDSVKSLDDAAEFIQKLQDGKQENGKYQFSNLVDNTLIKSLEDRLYEAFNQLSRLDIVKPRSRQKRGSGGALEGSTAFGSSNIFQDAIGSLGEIFGFGSIRRMESLRHHVNFVAKNIYIDQAELSTRLGALSERMADSITQLQDDLGKVLTNLYTKDKTRYAILHNIRGVVEQAEAAVSLFLEIRDQADLRLPSRMILSEKTLQNYLENTTRTNRDLRPIYPDARAYFRLPLAETHFHQEENMFTTVMRIPMTRDTEYFYKDQNRLAYVRLTSDQHHVFITPQDEVDCKESTTDIVCLNRPCRLNKFEDALKSCVVTRSEKNHDDTLELLYSETHLKKNTGEKIVMMCQGKRFLFPVTKEVIQLRLPQHCSVKNEYFSVDNIITTDVPTTHLQDNELSMNFKQVSLNASEEEFVSKITIKSPATIQIVEGLRQEAKSAQETAKKDREHADEINDTYGAFHDNFFSSNITIGLIVVGLFVVAILIFCCLIKKC